MTTTKVVNFEITEEVIEKAKLIVDEMKWCIDNILLFNGALVYTEYSTQGILWWKKPVIIATQKEDGLELPRTLYWSVYRYISVTSDVSPNIKLGEACKVANNLPELTVVGDFVHDISALQPGDVVTHEAYVITAFRNHKFININEVQQ